MSVFIIAEAGVNHNGDPLKALKLIDAAVESGADAIKFQTFKAENLVTKFAEKAEYQKKSLKSEETQLQMLQKLELNKEAYFKLFNYARTKNIEIMSTAFDSGSLRFLINELEVKKLKISSGDITNEPFLLEHAQSGLDIILSTGISNMKEIEKALSVIAFGLLSSSSDIPKKQDFKEAFASTEGQKALSKKVTILHCTSEYPTPPAEVNLKAITTLSDTFGLSVGFSDHTEGYEISLAAIAMDILH